MPINLSRIIEDINKLKQEVKTLNVNIQDYKKYGIEEFKGIIINYSFDLNSSLLVLVRDLNMFKPENNPENFFKIVSIITDNINKALKDMLNYDFKDNEMSQVVRDVINICNYMIKQLDNLEGYIKTRHL